jgi:FtsP/CotA-like multicopper oxidase with cupredoxin domain
MITTRSVVPSLVVVCVLAVFALLPAGATAQTPTPVAPVPNPCPRLAAGGVVHNPPALYSTNGVLNVRFSYQQTADSVGRLLHCFMTDTGIEQPTLHVNPGDTLNITVTNNTPPQPYGEVYSAPNCGSTTVQFTPPANGIASTGASTNLHFHGTNVTPACGGDNVTRTLINPANNPANPGDVSTFQYSFTIPANEPPGLYWYHPHVHGLAERDLLGGATGALVVDGIQNVQPAVSGLRQRFIVLRDQPQLQGLAEGPGNCGANVPFQDLTVNYVPVDSNATFNSRGKLTNITFTPAVLDMAPGETQFWRVVNSAADTISDLQVLYDGVPQTLQIVAIDAVPVNSQEGTQPGQLIPVTRYRLPVAGRVEFLVQAPSSRVKVAQLVTNNIDTGPQGDCDPTRPIFNIQLSTDAAEAVDNNVGSFAALSTTHQRFAGASTAAVSTTRTFQFSEIQPSQFFITQVSAGQQPMVFDSNSPPAVVTTQGAVEQWNVQNIALENHEFHMHQIHFKVLSQDNFEVNGAQQAPAINGQFLDMIEVPFWTGKKNVPIPQVELLMDFQGMDIGDFVYHCHILSHEDLGMMQIIRVNPAN